MNSSVLQSGRFPARRTTLLRLLSVVVAEGALRSDGPHFLWQVKH